MFYLNEFGRCRMNSDASGQDPTVRFRVRSNKHSFSRKGRILLSKRKDCQTVKYFSSSVDVILV